MLTLSNIEYAYGNVKTLHGIDMKFESGKVTCVMGRNGVGKTTLLRNIIGLLRPAAGYMEMSEKDITRLAANKKAKQGIALVPQGRMIFPKLTVEENLKVGLQGRRDRVRKIPDEVLETFPILKEFLKRRGGDLSGGQQQQLSIARALMGDPKVLLLDEPTEGIQPNIIQQIGHVLRQLVAEKNMAVVLVEQYVDFVKEFGDWYYIMNRGRVATEGIPGELTDEIVQEHLTV